MYFIQTVLIKYNRILKNCYLFIYFFTCLMVIIIVKTIGPNFEIVLNMNNCPQAELTDKTIQSVKNTGY